MGVKEVIFGILPDMKLDTISHVELNQSIYKIIDQVKPEIIYTHYFGDVNKDHQLISESTLVACRPLNKFIKKVYMYEVLSSTEWGEVRKSFSPNVYSIINGENLNLKLQAMKEYTTELRDYPHPRSLESIKNLAKQRGNSICEEYAESFYLVREIF